MEERQTQIREGAGLEESKLNVEFIDWLQKWSTPILMVIAVAALGVVVFKRWEKAKLAKVDQAFAELTAAAEVPNPNPESLKGIADQYEGIRAVPTLARLNAADEYLAAVRKGTKTGAKIGPDGAVPPEDLLSDEERTRYLSEAERLYKTVADKNAMSADHALHAIDAEYGLAAVAMCRGDTPAATRAWEQVAKLAESRGLTPQAEVAKKRIENLGKLGPMPKLYAAAELPKPPEPPKPPTPTIPDFTLPTTGGEPGATGVTGSTGATGEPAATGTLPAPTGAPASTGEPPKPAAPKPETPPPAPTGSPAAPK